MDYHFKGEEQIDSPALIFYEDVIEENTARAVTLAGGAERLWPHVKTHKTQALVSMQLRMGITRFKCATIAEAELCARANAPCVLLAYPLIGPAISRFIGLRSRYAQTEFWALGDDLGQLRLLGEAAVASGNPKSINTLIDVNLGMNRTGVAPAELEAFYPAAAGITGLSVRGFHGYDGHLGIHNFDERQRAVAAATARFDEVLSVLEKSGAADLVLVLGGTPTFPCHRERRGAFLSPGTFFVQDQGYTVKYPDLAFTPGAAVLSRVISRPAPGLFTLDTGYKGIASDQIERGVIAGMPEAKPLSHSEEHWVWQQESGPLPRVGEILYILPNHICPTSALYPGVYVVRKGELVNYWEITARNRKIIV